MGKELSVSLYSFFLLFKWRWLYRQRLSCKSVFDPRGPVPTSTTLVNPIAIRLALGSEAPGGNEPDAAGRLSCNQTTEVDGKWQTFSPSIMDHVFNHRQAWKVHDL